MCGIVGFLGDCSKEKLQQACQLITHRGPDDHGLFYQSLQGQHTGVGLAHTRLAILDLSAAGRQPMMAEEDQVTLIYNGEIYNYRELRTELEKQGYCFSTQTDTEVLLKAYLAFGTQLLKRLNGIFSFAICDTRLSTPQLFLARDAFGVKPLYYFFESGLFAFASEIKALLPLFAESHALDAQVLARYLAFQWAPGNASPLQAVQKIGPGQAMLLQLEASGKVKIHKQWSHYSLPAQTARQGLLQDSSKQAVQKTKELLQQAVHRQMVADAPLGAFLSGGLDSSAVVTFAAEVNANIQCFTINNGAQQERGETDDLPYARQVAKHLGVALHEVTVDPNVLATSLENMVYALDEPVADPAALNVLLICQLAKQHGVKVLLSGAGGDDIFTGYRRHFALQQEKWWSIIPLPMRKKLATLVRALPPKTALLRRVRKMALLLPLSAEQRLLHYFLWAELPQLRRLVRPERQHFFREESLFQPMTTFLQQLPLHKSALDKMLALEQRFFLSDHNLHYTDKMSMQAGVEVRVPFLDPDLVNYTLKIRDDDKQRRHVGKWVLKKALSDRLPKQVIYRKKTGFGAPLRCWIKGELKSMVADYLSPQALTGSELYDGKAVWQLVQDNQQGRVDVSYTVFALLCAEIWRKKFAHTAAGKDCVATCTA